MMSIKSLSVLAGAAIIVAESLALGLITNSLRPDPLPLLRKPASQTNRYAGRQEIAQLIQPKSKQAKADVKPNTTVKPQIEQKKTDSIAPAVPEDKVQNQNPQNVVKKPVLPKKHVKQAVHPKIVSKQEKPVKLQALFTNLGDAKKLYDKGGALFIDARHSEDFDEEHIRGAVNLYAEDFNQLYEHVLGKVDKNRTIITYCSDPQCDTSIKLGDMLAANGYKHVLILLEGLPGWKDSGYPTEKAGAK